MSSINQVTSYSEFLSFLQEVCPAETVSQVAQLEPAVPNYIFEESSLSRSEQERIRDLAQIFLPPPTLTPTQLLEIYRTIDTRLSIANIGIAGSSSLVPFLGLMETAVLSAAVHEWALSETQEATRTKEAAIQKTQNPFGAIIQGYVNAQPKGVLTNPELAQKLAQLPGLRILLHGIPPSLLQSAYSLAEQQIVSALLDKWIENEAQNVKLQREEYKRLNIKSKELSYRLMKQELLKALVQSTKTTPLSQPLFSVITLGCLFTPSTNQLDSSTPPGFDVQELLDPFHFPEILTSELALFAQGISLTALAWATPTAAAIKHVEKKEVHSQYLSSLSARSYCLSLAKVLSDPAIHTFLKTRADILIKKSLLSPKEADQATASFRAVLLLQAIVALYHSEMGGVTPEEIQALLDGTLTVDPESLLATMTKLINFELDSLSKKQKDTFIASALEKIVSSKSTQTITEPTRCFFSLWNPKYSQTVAMSCQS